MDVPHRATNLPSRRVTNLTSAPKPITHDALVTDPRIPPAYHREECVNIVITWLRIAIGITVFGVTTTLCMLACALCFPFRLTRIKICNLYGKVTGPLMMRISGCPLTIRGAEHLDGDRPAIYVSNHTSAIDIFLAIFLSPIGTVGIAKKQVVYYPFLGQLYLLSGHLRIDRGRSSTAKDSMNRLASYVRGNKLSIYLWPEGTRSREGHLLPSKRASFISPAKPGCRLFRS